MIKRDFFPPLPLSATGFSGLKDVQYFLSCYFENPKKTVNPAQDEWFFATLSQIYVQVCQGLAQCSICAMVRCTYSVAIETYKNSEPITK